MERRGINCRHATRGASARWTRLIAILAIATLICAGSAVRAGPAGGLRAREYQVKAAFLFHFLSFIHYEDGHAAEYATGTSTCKIAIVGQDPFGSSFEPVEGRTVPGQQGQVALARFPSIPTTNELAGCRITFIAASEKRHLEQALARLASVPTLTVSDMDGFLEAGGMVRLIEVNNKVRWEINRTAVDKAGLRLSSQLLRSAVRVITQEENLRQTSGTRRVGLL